MRRLISQSIWRKLMAMVIAIAAFVLLYETRAFDTFDFSGFVESPADAKPAPGSRLRFAATAYCKGSTTASGVEVRTGIAAADQRILPVGSVISITTDQPKYDGIYTVMDTGPRVRGRMLDVYIWSCYEALAFGRKDVQVTVLRLGWNPRASTPGLIDRIFRRREGG
jgi:3D (Asp-Asp-Asp) domain-containing protein